MQDTIHEPTTVGSTESTEHNEATEFLKDVSPIPLRASRFQHAATVSFLPPEWSLFSALIAGVIASVLSVLLTILTIHYMRLGKYQGWSLWKRTSRQASSTRT
jgi:hypothetical protein